MSPVAGKHYLARAPNNWGAACPLETPGCFWSPPQGHTSGPGGRALQTEPQERGNRRRISQRQSRPEGTSLFNHTAPVPASLARSLDSDDMAPMFDLKVDIWSSTSWPQLIVTAHRQATPDSPVPPTSGQFTPHL